MHRQLIPLYDVMMAKGADVDLTSDALIQITTLLRKASLRDRRLETALRINRNLVAEAIFTATGQKPEEVLVISVERPFARPRWMTDASHATMFRESIGKDIEDAFASTDGVATRFWGLCEQQRRVDSWMDVHDVHWKTVRPHITSWAHGGFPRALGQAVERCLDQTTRLLLGFALLGDDDGLRRLTPLMRLMNRTIPIARKKDEDGIWLTLAA